MSWPSPKAPRPPHGQSLRGHFEHGTVAVRAACEGCAVEIALGVEDQSAAGELAVGFSLEFVEDRFRARRGYFILRSGASIAPTGVAAGEAIEIALCILNQSAGGIISVAFASELVEHREFPRCTCAGR